MSDYDPSAVQLRYGRTPTSVDQIKAYLKALKIIIGADGEISPPELAAMRKGMKRLGVAEDVAAEIEAFDHENADLNAVLSNMRPGGKRARMLLYDCVVVSSADGVYAKEEKAAVAQAAETLGVDKATLKSLEALVELESGVRHLHKALFPKKK